MSKQCPSPSQPSLTWLFVLTLVGYPIAGLLASGLDWESTVVSIPFRAAVLLLSVWVLSRARPSQPRRQAMQWLFAFWLVYLIRLVWDWLVAGVPGSLEATIFFILTVVIPCRALALGAPALSERNAVQSLVWIGTAICAAAVLMHFLQVGSERSLTERTGRLSFEAINPITLGHVATTTLIAVLCLTQRRLSAMNWMALIPAVLVAGTCLVLAASRGPVVALALAAIAFVASTRRWRWLLLMALLLLPQLPSQDGELWVRFASIDEDDSALQRLLLQGNAIAQFLSHPLLGNAFVELEFLEYPHNLFIESAMALGIVGSAILVTVLFKALLAALRLSRRGQLLIPLLFVQYFVSAQLSGAIWGNAGLWATTALLISLAPVSAPRRKGRQLAPRPTNTLGPMAPHT